jgi:hypothetical protein
VARFNPVLLGIQTGEQAVYPLSRNAWTTPDRVVPPPMTTTGSADRPSGPARAAHQPMYTER